MKTLNNKVLVRLEDDPEVIKLKGGVKLYIDISYETEKHITTKGTVIEIPSHLSAGFGKMDWLTGIEIAVGDTVYFSEQSVMYSLGKKYNEMCEFENPSWFEKDGFIHVLIDYGDIYYCNKPINSFVLVDKHPETVSSILGIEEDSNVYGTVRETSSNNNGYFECVDVGDWRFIHRDMDLFPGEKVVWRTGANVPAKDFGCYKIQKKHLMAAFRDKWVPLADNIMLERIPHPKTSPQGIIIPDTAEYKFYTYRVTDVGDKVEEIAVGDYVILRARNCIEFDGHYVVRETKVHFKMDELHFVWEYREKRC